MSCGWRAYNSVPKVLNKINVMTVFSSSLPSCLNFAIRNHLQSNQIKLIDINSLNHNLISLNVIKSSLNQEIVSMFSDGKIAEYRITLLIQANIFIPNDRVYPINIKIYRLLFNHSQIPLKTFVTQKTIINEMYQEAAEQLVHKLLYIRDAHSDVTK